MVIKMIVLAVIAAVMGFEILWMVYDMILSLIGKNDLYEQLPDGTWVEKGSR